MPFPPLSNTLIRGQRSVHRCPLAMLYSRLGKVLDVIKANRQLGGIQYD